MQIRDQAKQAAAAAEKKRDFKASGRLFEAARRIDRNDQAAHIGANNAVAYQQRQDAMVAKQKELAGHIARGDWHLAETSQAELKIIDEGLPGGLTPETRDLMKRYQDGQAAYTRQVDAKRKEIAADLQAKRYEGARAKLAALRQTHLIPADEDWARGMAQAIDQAEAESQAQARKPRGAPAAIAGKVSGKWRSSEGEVTLVQSGRAVKRQLYQRRRRDRRRDERQRAGGLLDRERFLGALRHGEERPPPLGPHPLGLRKRQVHRQLELLRQARDGRRRLERRAERGRAGGLRCLRPALPPVHPPRR
jgi:hypothetical protein